MVTATPPNIIAMSVVVSGILLVFYGIYSMLTARNLLRVLTSIEVAFNGGILLVLVAALYAYAVYGSGAYAGLLVLVAVALTAVEVAVLTAIILLTYRQKGSISVEKVRELRG